VDACLKNQCVRAYIAAGEPGYTVESIRRSPIVRVEFEQAIAIGGIGETLEATRSKHWERDQRSRRLSQTIGFLPTASRTCTVKTAGTTSASSNGGK